MRITFCVFVTTFIASVALSQENAQITGVSAGGKTCLVQVNGVTVAMLPADPKRTISVECSGIATYNKDKGTANFTKAVRLVASIPDQAAITITGENLTVLPQK